jgi:hypothetical protein
MFDERQAREGSASGVVDALPSDARHPPAFVKPEDVRHSHSGRSRNLFDLEPDRLRPDQKTLN